MLHFSPPPVEIGVFDFDEANRVANDIVNSAYISSQTVHSGRLVVGDEASEDIENRIELLTTEELFECANPQKLRTRMYAQVFSEIEKNKFPGYKWHVDYEGSLYNPNPIDFSFGSSNHSTEFFVGQVDLSRVRSQIQDELDGVFEKDQELALPALLVFGGLAVQSAIDLSLQEGNGLIVESHPGVLYKIPTGSIHKMKEFDSKNVNLPRFCIEKYLISK